MPHGIVFILLFLIIATGVAVLLVVRILRRALIQRLRVWSIVAMGVAALAVWAGASYPNVPRDVWNRLGRRTFTTGPNWNIP